eukprot:CAMPEP_0197285280 /NCGR_PEP_ID=MMETSP0890-20130614/493_1 /TAXON_ID=44058 ORGANISM="Aureoumbra lagunensis, Strain CCMP1510" /NCGR_SAMPLE_ID=MMETSP0890 /ASSEMBLY_ACC=CAM_ASM_000533 /LENGTH=602 /DNA_ID=CAMNT_0042752619 /DNA_START=14 /DNA_END=1822 /DNA_ORIENTATION=+
MSDHIALPLAGAASYEELLKCISADEWDFLSWTKLLSLVEAKALANENIDRVVPTFEGFLRRFPLCFGYWSKYADLQATVVRYEVPTANDETIAAAKTVLYERALEQVPLSVELWTAYCAHVALTEINSQGMRQLYERALYYVGAERQSVPLWEAFLDFEASRGTPSTVCNVYRRGLAVDTTGRIDELWRKFKLLTRCYKISELIENHQETSALLKRYKARKQFDAESSEEEARRLKSMAGYSALEEQRQMEQLLFETEQAKNACIQRTLQRQKFELGIRRWYFHVKPLDEAQLENWRQYLYYEMQNTTKNNFNDTSVSTRKNNFAQVDHLFERCLIPCALYAEFWLSYAFWKYHSRNDFDLAIDVLQRALTKFLPKRPDIMETLALFLEAAGRCEEARQVYIDIFEFAKPDAARLAACCLKRAAFETRQHDVNATLAAFRTTLHIIDGPHFNYIASQMARFQALVIRDVPAARVTLDYAISNRPDDPRLWLARIQLEMMQMYQERVYLVVDLVSAVYERALAPETPLSFHHKLDIWSRYLYFAQAYAYSVTSILDIKRRLAEFRTTVQPDVSKVQIQQTPMPAELEDIPELSKFDPAPPKF